MSINTTPVHDELQLGEALGDFKPVGDRAGNVLAGWLSQSAGAQVQGTFTRLSADSFIVGVAYAAKDWVGLLHAVELPELRTFEGKDGRLVSYHPKQVVSYRYVGKMSEMGESATDEIEAHVAEIRAGLELQVARDIEGFDNDPFEPEVSEVEGLDD